MTDSQYERKRSTEGHKLDKRKMERKTKKEDVCRWTSP